jgi:hypothetical protein
MILAGRWEARVAYRRLHFHHPKAREVVSAGTIDADDDKRLEPPTFLQESSLAQKINDRLVAPFNAMTFITRRLEKLLVLVL